jgi:heme oxygenase (biliverdin-IX-beta and delta-forming)
MSLTIPITSVAQILKEATQYNHMKAEELLGPKLTDICNLQDYTALLKMFYGFFQPVEGQVRRWISGEILEEIAERRNSALILNDLKNIGLDTNNIELCDHLPIIESISQALWVWMPLCLPGFW